MEKKSLAKDVLMSFFSSVGQSMSKSINFPYFLLPYFDWVEAAVAIKALRMMRMMMKADEGRGHC